MPSHRTWRQWHRWVSAPSALWFVFVAITGVLLAATEFFGEAEAERERLRDVVSPITTQLEASTWTSPLQRAFATAASTAPGAPVDRVEWHVKRRPSTVTLYLGKPSGGEDRKLVFDAATGALLTTEDYADKPFLVRLHSGEALGDGGLVFAMLFGLALLFVTISGVVLYLQMRKPGGQGLRRVFW
jgi:uncharacterized iron-regulated membrane protein